MSRNLGPTALLAVAMMGMNPEVFSSTSDQRNGPPARPLPPPLTEEELEALRAREKQKQAEYDRKARQCTAKKASGLTGKAYRRWAKKRRREGGLASPYVRPPVVDGSFAQMSAIARTAGQAGQANGAPASCEAKKVQMGGRAGGGMSSGGPIG